MKQTYKQPQARKRDEAESIELPTGAAADTTDAADLIAAIDELLGESQ